MSKENIFNRRRYERGDRYYAQGEPCEVIGVSAGNILLLRTCYGETISIKESGEVCHSSRQKSKRVGG